MTAAVLGHKGITNPFLYINNRERTSTNAVSTASASAKSTSHSTSMTTGTISAAAEASTGAFGRMRSTIEQSLRNATRSKKTPSPDADEFATITARPAKGKGKEKEVPVPVPKPKESSKSNLLLSKVTFGRAGRESLTPSPIPPAPVKKDASDVVRQAGFTSYLTPSLRGGSMSSPSLPLSSEAAPSHKSRPPIPAPSSSTTNVVRSPSRDRHARSSMQSSPREISAPIQLGSRRDAAHQTKPSSSSKHTTRHRSTQSVPQVPSNQLSPSPSGKAEARRPSDPTRSRRKDAELPSPPSSPSPTPPSPTSPNSQFYASSRRVAASSGHLPLNTSPLAPRTMSPGRTRSSRVVTPTQRELLSPTSSNIPSTPSSPTQSARRPSVDSPSRSALGKARRPSNDSPHRPSMDSTRRPSGSSPRRPSVESPRSADQQTSGIEFPTPRPRPLSPNQRNYAQNRHFNMSTTSLTGPPNPEYREVIRTATSMLCKELVKKPAHLSKTESGAKEWALVEDRMNALRRAERMWSPNSASPGSPTSSGFTNAEERERRLFWETLRDGFVLCHLLNKMRSGFVVKPDPREERLTRLSNVNKFLAACASYGLHDSEIFSVDDLTEGTGECLARVAKTIIALIKHVETPMSERSNFISAPEPSRRPAPIAIPPRHNRYESPPRGSPGLAPRASLSTSPGRRRFSPPSGLPPVRARDDDVFFEDSGDETEGPSFNSDRPPVVLTPPPKSPLRARATRRHSDNRYHLGSPPSPMSSSVPNSSSLHESFAMRKSVASSNLTESTVVTDTSSIFDVGRSRTYSNGQSKFGTIRTMTTDVTSEAPSMSRAEGYSAAEELARKWHPLPETPTKAYREIKLSDAAEVMRVVEEGDESVASSRSGGGKNKERGGSADRDQPITPSKQGKPNAINLRKGKWPEDFLDVFRGEGPVRTLDPDLSAYLDDQESTTSVISTSSAISASPSSRSSPRKLAIVEGNQRNDGQDPIPRRPTHRARQTADAPILLPKETLQLRESSPDTSLGSSGRVLLRRHSTKPSVTSRSAVALQPKLDTVEATGITPVPFPRTNSGEYHNGETGPNERPKLHRGRFQSDIDFSSARRRTRPTSSDGPRIDRRSRIESMGHLGSRNESASDLLSTQRDSMDGSVVRKTLVVREDGKAPVHFQLGNCIGRGQFGTVYRALNLNTGQTAAVKRIRLEGLKEDEVTQLMREVDLMKSLSHPSIVKYEGMERDQDTLSIVLEYAENGSLGQTLKAFGKLNERLVANYVVKILEGLHYLHENDVVHCDLKAANILTTKTGNVKLSDFGVSLNLRAMERDQKDVAGTPNWMAPEVIELKGASTKSDIWSLGCTVVELLTGRPPYAEITNSMSVMFRIVEDPTPPLPDDCSPLLEDFLLQCFHKEPAHRPSAELLFEHPWLKQNWGLNQELRPQDSIPFLRRVSADLHKQRSDVMKLLAKGEMPPSPSTSSPQSPVGPSALGPSPLGRRGSDLSTSILGGDNDLSVREHSFVKTTFSKPMICRVCLLNVKKSAVLCAQCSLIAHSKCTPDAPPTCDLRAQLLLYAKFADAGNPTSQYSNPADGLPKTPAAPASDVPYISHSPRTSIDGAASPLPLPPLPANAHPPVAYRLMGAFKRSRSNLAMDTMTKGSGSQERPESASPTNKKRPTAATKSGRHERPISTTSNSTERNSIRSAATGGGSTSSRFDKRSAPSSSGKSATSPLAEPTPTSSKLTTQSAADTIDTVDTTEYGEIDYNEAIPGSLPADARRHRRKDSNCNIQ